MSYFSTIFIIIGFIVVVATIYELSTNSSSEILSTKHHLSNGNGIHTLTNENLNHKFVNGKQLELHQLPADNNNIVTDAGDVEPSKRRNKISANEKLKTEKVGTCKWVFLGGSKFIYCLNISGSRLGGMGGGNVKVLMCLKSYSCNRYIVGIFVSIKIDEE